MKESKSFWLCTACGKWSTARRRPRHHQRFVGEDLPGGAAITAETHTYEPDTGAPVTYFWVRCGPFEEWIAERAA